MQQQLILDLPIHVTNYSDAVSVITRWAVRGESRSVCAANVHVVMEAQDRADYKSAVRDADLITADGVPLVWGLRLLGWKNATRVYGPDLMLHVLEEAERKRVPVGLYGGSSETLHRLIVRITERWPRLEISFCDSPPFRSLTEQEDEAAMEAIRRSGTRLLFVGLGCPKQEYWMAAHKSRLDCVLLGVGAAFDFIAGTKRQAPLWMRAAGLEWVFRLGSEPHRLWQRYARHNPRFVAAMAAQLLRGKQGTQ